MRTDLPAQFFAVLNGDADDTTLFPRSNGDGWRFRVYGDEIVDLFSAPGVASDVVLAQHGGTIAQSINNNITFLWIKRTARHDLIPQLIGGSHALVANSDSKCIVNFSTVI